MRDDIIPRLISVIHPHQSFQAFIEVPPRIQLATTLPIMRSVMVSDNGHYRVEASV